MNIKNNYVNLLVSLSDTLEKFDLVQSRLRVVAGALHHLESHELLILEVPAQPDGTEVAPAKLPDDVVSVVEEIANLDRMVASLTVITGGLLFVVIRAQNLLLLLVIVLEM